MDKVQKHNSIKTNTASSESYKNYLKLHLTLKAYHSNLVLSLCLNFQHKTVILKIPLKLYLKNKPCILTLEFKFILYL